MEMRIIWGKIMPGQWDAFEAAFQKALEIRGQVKGLKAQWLLRDQNDPDAQGMPFRNGKARQPGYAGVPLPGEPEARRSDGGPAAVLCQSIHDHQLRGSDRGDLLTGC